MSNETERPLALIILDGWGISSATENNAIARAHTPYYDAVCAKYPRTTLAASGGAEVGHLTIGSGRRVEPDAARAANAVASGDLLRNPTLLSAFAKAAGSGVGVHFIGLVSDGGIHSSTETLYALLRMAKQCGIGDAFVHAILDGRDVPPRTADIYVEALEIKMADIGLGRIASLCGRFYAMDGGTNWERTARAYTMLVHGEGERSFDAVSAIRASFLRGIGDEFIAPIVIECKIDVPLATVKDGDLAVFFNHRGEQIRQLVRSLSVADPSTSKPKIDTVCLTEYDRAFGLPSAFEPVTQHNVLAHVFRQNGVADHRITETARSLHVSDYFDCDADSSADCVTLPVGAGQTLEAAPESMSFKIADRAIRGIIASDDAVLVVNFPAAALLADTGNFEKTVEAIQFIDTCLDGLLERLADVGGRAVITSSHAGCEEMTAAGDAETKNPVPLHIIDPANAATQLSSGGTLEDVAPTVLGMLGIPKPPEMTGRDLRI